MNSPLKVIRNHHNLYVTNKTRINFFDFLPLIRGEIFLMNPNPQKAQLECLTELPTDF